MTFVFVFLIGFLAGYIFALTKPGKVISGRITFGDSNMSKSVVHADQTSVPFSLKLLDSKGNPVVPSVPIVWSMTVAGVATLALDAGNLSGTLSNFAPGDTLVDALVDGADTEDGNPKHFQGDLQVLPAGVATGEVDFGAVT